MNINKLISMVPASFDYECPDESGEMSVAKINLKLNRFSFKEATKEEFQDAMKNAEKDPEVIGGLLVKLIASWDLFEDDEGTQMYPITVDNIIDRPADFVMALSECVFAKLFPNPQKAANSPAGSAPVESSTALATTSAPVTTSVSPAASGA